MIHASIDDHAGSSKEPASGDCLAPLREPAPDTYPATIPVIWSIAGTDSGGGAGLSADQRAADAFGVHLCPIVAAVTAQHSQGVARIEPMSPALIDAQLQALHADMPPRVVKTGLLGGAAQVRLVARWIDRLRESGPVALVVDPVLAASTGTAFVDAEALQAYRDELVPRATVITPNRREAALLLGDVPVQAAAATNSAAGRNAVAAGRSARADAAGPPASLGHPADVSVAATSAGALPALAKRLREAGAEAVCITGGDSADVDGQVLDWLSSEHADGWLASPRVTTVHSHGTGCTFASSVAAALALGFVPADAAILGKMATTHALRCGHAAGGGAGPVQARAGFASDPSLLPLLSWDEALRFGAKASPAAGRSLGLYAIVDSAERVLQVLAAGVRTVQLRIKTPDQPNAAWHAELRTAVRASVDACRAVSETELFVNDHWELALELGAGGVHLGQEDLLMLGDAGRARLQASGLALGISSHSLWELCRARTLAPRYIACGPVWPTLTKAMPWQPQGLDNLSWWCHMAQVPVVAIGGILQEDRVRAAAACGVDGVCVVRALGDDPAAAVSKLQAAFERGRSAPAGSTVPALPHSALARAPHAAGSD